MRTSSPESDHSDALGKLGLLTAILGVILFARISSPPVWVASWVFREAEYVSWFGFLLMLGGTVLFLSWILNNR